MVKCDTFILLDDVLFTKGGYINRVKIGSPRGPRWLTVPVKQQGLTEMEIRDVEMANVRWRSKAVKSFEQFYGRTPYFQEWWPKFEVVIRNLDTRVCPKLYTMNLLLIWAVMEGLGIPTEKVAYASMLLGEDHGLGGTERLIALTKAVEGTTYLSGMGGRDYQDEELFGSEGIEVEYCDMTRLPTEMQHGLSIVDTLFKCGKDTMVALGGA